MHIIAPTFIKCWQTPAQTEKFYYVNHLLYANHCDTKYKHKDLYYFAFPWASFLDYYNKDYDSVIYEPNNPKFEQNIRILQSRGYLISDTNYTITTICQHIYWYKLIHIWKHLNITHAYCSHLTNHPATILVPDIKFASWSLYAVNKENTFRNKNLFYIPPKNKKYLCSFIGCIDEPFYRSDIRRKIYNIMTSCSHADVFLSVNQDWFFRNETFSSNIATTITKDVEQYNTVLSNSVFSLCPEGSGPNTIRLWESMSVGSIPVLFENDWVKPEISYFDWSDLAITIKKTEIKDLIEILKSVSVERIEQMSINCINAYSIFKNQICIPSG
jgi:hypothetical protein